MFGKRDIGRVEREFLDVLDWELSLRESDIIAQYNLLLATIRPTQPHAYHHYRNQTRAGSATRRSSTFEFDDDSDWSDSEDGSCSSSDSDGAPRTPVHSQGPPHIFQGPRERRIVSQAFVMYDTKPGQKRPDSRTMYPPMPQPPLKLELPDPIDSIAFVPTHAF